MDSGKKCVSIQSSPEICAKPQNNSYSERKIYVNHLPCNINDQRPVDHKNHVISIWMPNNRRTGTTIRNGSISGLVWHSPNAFFVG